MGALFCIYSAPPDGNVLTKSQYVNLLRDATEKEYIHNFFALFQGSLPAHPVFFWSQNQPYYEGSNFGELLDFLDKCRFGEEDLAVWFDGFGSNELLPGHLVQGELLGIDNLVFYAHSEPKLIEIEDEILKGGFWDWLRYEIYLQHNFCGSGEPLGLPSIKETFLDDFFIRHFGEDYQHHRANHGVA